MTNTQIKHAIAQYKAAGGKVTKLPDGQAVGALDLSAKDAIEIRGAVTLESDRF